MLGSGKMSIGLVQFSGVKNISRPSYADLAQSNRLRYASWAALAPSAVALIPVAWGNGKPILTFETQLIQALQAPTQTRNRLLEVLRVNKRRLYPRLRACPSLEAEQALNVHAQG